MKKYRKLILLLVFLLLLGLFFYLRKAEPKETILKVIPVDSLAISKIWIEDKADTVIVYKKGELWMMSHPDDAPANPDMINFFFQNVYPSTYTGTAMSEDKTLLHQYGLDKDHEVQLKLFDSKDKLLVHCRFGNTNNPFDYFRYSDSNKIYQVRPHVISGRLKPDANSWRSPLLLNLQPYQLSGISVSYDKNSYVLTRKDEEWFYMDAREQFRIPDHNITMGKILNILQNMEAFRYKKPSEVNLKDLKKEVEIDVSLTDKGSHNLVFYKEGDSYYLILDHNTNKYYEMLFDHVFRFTRHAEMFSAKTWEG